MPTTVATALSEDRWQFYSTAQVQNYPAAQTLSPPCCLTSDLVPVMYELQQGHKREPDHGRQEEDCPEAL